MAATFLWCEDNGNAVENPPHGVLRTQNISQAQWKSVDNAVADYRLYCINAGGNSFTKYVYGKFTGTFNSISQGLWAHTSGVLPQGIAIKGKVLSLYQTPDTQINSTLSIDMTYPSSIQMGQMVLFNYSGPEGVSPSTTLISTGYTQYLATQLQTNISATAGDIAPIVFTLRYDEN